MQFGIQLSPCSRAGRCQDSFPQSTTSNTENKLNEQKHSRWPDCWVFGGSTSAAVCVCWVCLKLLLSRFVRFVAVWSRSGEPVRPGSNLLQARFMVTGGYPLSVDGVPVDNLQLTPSFILLFTVYFVVNSVSRESFWTSRHLVFPRVPFEGAFKSNKAARRLRTLRYIIIIGFYCEITFLIINISANFSVYFEY